MSFDFQLQEVAQSRHVDESQLPDLLHVDLGEVLNAGHPEATLGANEALQRRGHTKLGFRGLEGDEMAKTMCNKLCNCK